jgi:hypothetical protein
VLFGEVLYGTAKFYEMRARFIPNSSVTIDMTTKSRPAVSYDRHNMRCMIFMADVAFLYLVSHISKLNLLRV